MLGVGAVSALLGVLYALMEHDLKRLLAYHSVENIGIILIGIGAGLIFHSYGLTSLAALGFIGGLYHTLNHACFKGLLFLGAGSVLHGAHAKYGRDGRTDQTNAGDGALLSDRRDCDLRLPPLNGFASEWLVFQSLLGGFNIPKPEVAVMMPAAVGAGADERAGRRNFVKASALRFWRSRARARSGTCV